MRISIPEPSRQLEKDVKLTALVSTIISSKLNSGCWIALQKEFSNKYTINGNSNGIKLLDTNVPIAFESKEYAPP